MGDMLEIAKQVDAFFMQRSPVHDTMRKLAAALRELDIPFAIAGAMAGNAHGHLRTTADIDILIRRDDLIKFKERWLGLGWLELFEGSRGFRDTENNVKVDVMLVGDYPGDGREKPVAFPPPESVTEVRGQGLPYVTLNTLIELKLASGITAKHRLQDLADVIELIRANNLPREYAETLNPYVRGKFVEMWQAAQIRDDY
jgi:hypothetical protein